jgi:CBS-domain-containing membrane protein
MSSPKFVHGASLASDRICKALGLDMVQKLVLTIEVGDVVKVDVTKYTTEGELERVLCVLEEHAMKAVPMPDEDKAD